MKKIVLIGASGYVGSHILAEALNRGHKVVAVVRHPEKITPQDNLEVVKADVADIDALAAIATGADAIISAYNPGWTNPQQYDETLEIYPKIVSAAKKANVQRLLIVGGAGSLFVKPGVRVIDGDFPKEWLPGAKSLSEFYLNTLINEKDIDWVFFCPAAQLIPGERTGKFRLGKDDLLVDNQGESKISVQDYAVAMIDELEKSAHHKERFTIAY